MSEVVRHHNFRAENKNEKPPQILKDKSRGVTFQEISPLVRPGEYKLVYVTRFTTYCFKEPKLAIRFRIIDQGEFFGVELERWYYCKKLIGKPGKNKGFMPKMSGDFLFEYCTLFPDALTRHYRLDRISFKPFKNCVITGRVETVNKDSRQRNKPAPLQYSVIRELIKVGA